MPRLAFIRRQRIIKWYGVLVLNLIYQHLFFGISFLLYIHKFIVHLSHLWVELGSGYNLCWQPLHRLNSVSLSDWPSFRRTRGRRKNKTFFYMIRVAYFIQFGLSCCSRPMKMFTYYLLVSKIFARVARVRCKCTFSLSYIGSPPNNLWRFPPWTNKCCTV